MNVGTRELKNRLSHYLRRVREDGESVYVTDHGKVVAELRPVQGRGHRTDRQVLLDLIAKGDVSSGNGRFKKFRPAKLRRPARLCASAAPGGRIGRLLDV